MEGKTKFAFIGNSHIAYWPLESYFPQWECRNYGVPGEGLDYVERFHEDVSDSYVIIQMRKKREEETNVVYLDVFDKFLLNDRLNPDLTIDDLHLNGAGYRILVHTLRELFCKYKNR